MNFPCSKTLADVGSFLRIQEIRSTNQVDGGKVLRRAVPMDKSTNGELSFCCGSDAALTRHTGGGHSTVVYHC